MKRNNDKLNDKQKDLKKRKIIKSKEEYTNYTQITENIYLGNKVIAKDTELLNELGITHIVNCAEELEYILDNYNDENFDWLFLPMIDCSETGNVEDYIDLAISYINDAVKNNNKVLVHCAAGISRSSSIVIAYLMYKNRKSFNDTFCYVKDLRPCCKPNSAFIDQLSNYIFQ